MTEKHKKIISIVAVLIFIGFMVLVTVVVGRPLIQMANDPQAFENWIDSIGFLGKAAFVGIVVLQVLVAFIPGEPIELAAGYIFGFWEGSLLTMLGFLLGSCLVFLLVRKLGVKLVEVFFSKEKIDEIQFLKNPKKTKVLFGILMVIPGTPKDMLSYFAGLTKLTLSEWLLIVIVGRIPSLVTSTLTGAAAGEENYLLSTIMLVVTLLISVMGFVYYRHICKEEKEIPQT